MPRSASARRASAPSEARRCRISSDCRRFRSQVLTTGLDLFAWGDASEKAAAANGGITTVRHADYELRAVLWVYRTFTIDVYGD